MLPAAVWRPLREQHESRVDELTRGHRARAATGTAHPVEDFLFTYYSLRPSHLRRWYPGPGVALADAAERVGWRFHGPAPGLPPGAVTLNGAAFVAARGAQLGFTRRLLAATAARPGQFGCFGLHEWAMVYRQDGELRHDRWPLRLGQHGTDEVVRDHQIRCSHFDAFRFFTPPAKPLNVLQPDRESQIGTEQPGCLHAGMDVYKWAYKLIPAVPSDLLVDCFVLAARIRELDMRASPYDLSDLGYRPVRIETAAGKAEYVAEQREFGAEAAVLRQRLLAVIDELLDAVTDRHPVPGSSVPETAHRRS